MECDLIFKNALLWGHPPTVNTLAVRHGRIVAVGAEAEMGAISADRVIDCGSDLVTPGIWDAHIHLYHWSRARRYLRLGACHGKDQVLAALERYESPTDWVIGCELNVGNWDLPILPSRRELDEVYPEQPVLIWFSDLHSALVNSKALERAKLHAGSQVEGGLVELGADGLPSGILREMAANSVRDLVPEPTAEELTSLLQEGVKELNGLGITGVCDQRIKNLNEGGAVFRALAEMERAGSLSLRVSCNLAAHHLPQARTLGLFTGFGGERLKVGHVKVFSDGTLGSQTARMLEPMLGQEGRGLYLTTPQEMRECFRFAVEGGFSISVHSIGDESNRVCLDLFQELDHAGYSRPAIPHRIEHAQTVDDTDVQRFAALGLVISAQPGHALDDRRLADKYLGERARLCYRLCDFQKAGIAMAFGSDAPVSSVDPRYGLQVAVHRAKPGENPWYPQQRLSFQEALKGYTSGAAEAAGWGNLVGFLRPGARADLVVWRGRPDLSDNILDSTVGLTVVDGEVVHSDEPGASE